MAYVSSCGNIQLNRGDSLDLNISVNLGSNIEPSIYTLQEDDAVYFGIMEPNYPFECAIVKKRITAEQQDDKGNIVVHLTPDDTLCLIPGKYYYQVKLAAAPDRVVTIIDKSQFFILE